VPLQGTLARGDDTRGCAPLAPGYGASGPLGRWAVRDVPPMKHGQDARATPSWHGRPAHGANTGRMPVPHP